MEFIAATEFDGYILSGEAEFIGSAGVGDAVDAVLSYFGDNVLQSGHDIWEYYKSDVSTRPGVWMKAWLHWNGSEFDAYLKCNQDASGKQGFVSHAMPYISE